MVRVRTALYRVCSTGGDTGLYGKAHQRVRVSDCIFSSRVGGLART